MENTSKFRVGDIVRPSGYQTQRARDYWNSCGREPMKSAAKTALDKLINLRGEVVELKTPTRYTSCAIVVVTTDGMRHDSLDYLWERA